MSITDTSPEVVPSIAKASPEEQRALEFKLAREHAWYIYHKRFEAAPNIGTAVLKGELSFVGNDSNIVPVGRFRNPRLADRFPPYLLPTSLLAYKAIGRLWRAEMKGIGISQPALRLAGTSYVRSVEAQAKIVADPTKLASPKSNHCVGASFDIDAANAYWLDPESGVMRIIHPDCDQDSVDVISKALGNDPNPPKAPFPYEPEIFGGLIRVADELHRLEMINRVLEFKGSPNQAVHMTPNPAVPLQEWQMLAAA